jgi:hypothetical protein
MNRPIPGMKKALANARAFEYGIELLFQFLV